MKIYATVTSDRASKGQGGNEYIIVDLNVGRERIGQIELYYSADTENPAYSKEGINTDEWTLQYRPDEDTDWEIIAQGNVKPNETAKKQKGE
jgi:hypothetical protein